MLYGYGPYRKMAVLMKSKPMMVQQWLQTAVLRYFTVVQAENLFKTLDMLENYICDHVKYVLDVPNAP